VGFGGGVEGMSEGGDDEGAACEKHEDSDHSGRVGGEFEKSVFTSTEENSEAEDEDGVGEDRADEGTFDDFDESGFEGKYTDHEFGEIPEGALENAGCASGEPGSEVVGCVADNDSEQAEGGSGENKCDDIVGSAVGDAGGNAGNRCGNEDSGIFFGKAFDHRIRMEFSEWDGLFGGCKRLML
jgi:hypothetical protein